MEKRSWKDSAWGPLRLVKVPAEVRERMRKKERTKEEEKKKENFELGGSFCIQELE